MTTQQDTNEQYPVLTEVVQTDDIPIPTVDVKDQWDEVEQRLIKRIQTRISDRVSFVLEEAIDRKITQAVKELNSVLGEEIKRELRRTTEIIVTHAIIDEMQRLRQQIKK